MVNDVTSVSAVIQGGGLVISVCTVGGVGGLHDAVDVFQMLGTITYKAREKSFSIEITQILTFWHTMLSIIILDSNSFS